ncbi:(2Fe-2S)-binding protein [Ferrimonas balearica]|uniref:(2Fe-2S)-binding protein n=1 Tax=Ferrimonas balearica TaxID=44012 RepID=UPI001F3C30F3|nr:(2Fe-2S)-binding protein [Ferrimonas balearica]MBY6019592.1 (2Fe-2S)-binding protein [Halomonas denitrificans]MBY6096658.1 (2Fe-2S)-binding protein [Ferrimonas balearica]
MAVDRLIRLHQRHQHWREASAPDARPEVLLASLNQQDPSLRLVPDTQPVTTLAHWQVSGQLNQAIQARCHHLTTDPATACSLWLKLFNAHLMPSLTMMLLVHGQVPVLTAERLGVELDEQGNLQRLTLLPGLWLNAAEVGWDAVLKQFGDNLDRLLTPLQNWGRNDFRLAKSVFWGNLAFALSMGPAKLHHDADEALAEDLQEFIDTLPVPSQKKVRLQASEGRLMQKRATCCLKYNVPGRALCGTCCLDKPPRSTQRLYLPQEPTA